MKYIVVHEAALYRQMHVFFQPCENNKNRKRQKKTIGNRVELVNVNRGNANFTDQILLLWIECFQVICKAK